MTGKRLEPRTEMSLPVRIWGTDAGGRAFVETVFTRDLSASGARLDGVQATLARGATIAVRNANAQAHYRVMWVGEPGTPRAGQVGLLSLEPGKNIWALNLPRAQRDSFDPAMRAPAETAKPADAADAAYARAVSSRLQKISAELRELEQVLRAGLVDARILREFREVVNQMRHTSWAVQQYLDLQAHGGDPTSLIALLAAERIRVAVQLSRQLHADLASESIPKNAAGSEELRQAVEALAHALGTGPGKS